MIRRAEPQDRDFLLELKNDPEVREARFDPRIISPEEHRRWFEKVFESDNDVIYILEKGRKSIGQARYLMRDEDTYEVGVSIVRDSRNMKMGTFLLRLTSDFVLSHKKPKRIVSEIKKGNHASIKAFKNSGFRFLSETSDRIVLVKDVLKDSGHL